MDILILLSLIGFFIIGLCIVLHCSQHFRFRFCMKYKYRISTLPSYTTNTSGFNTFTRNKRLSTTNHAVHTHRRGTNNTTPIPEHTNLNLRVSNSMNIPTNMQRKEHHRTLSSLYEKRFTASISSMRASIHSFAGEGPKLSRTKCQFCIYGAEEDFDFFPSAFLLYIIFMICIITALMIRYFMTHNIHAILFTKHSINYKLFWILFHKNITHFSFIKLSAISTTRFYITDWMIAYCVMILSVWESLFNFYRYYTTMYAARYFYTIETKHVLKQYTYYLSVYCLIFLVNIHFYYWLFPITILMHFIFNSYSTFMFAHILIVQYKHIISTDSFLNDVHDEMLSSVYLMRKFSMFSCILSSIYIAILLIFYDVQMVMYAPIIWSICAVSFTLNFVRNRQFILRQFYKIQHCLIINNFSLVSQCDRLCKWRRDKCINNKNLNKINRKKHTENGNIADLKRQRKRRRDHDQNEHKGPHLALRNDSTLSITTPTQACTMKGAIQLSIASTADTLPTLKERGLIIKPISRISEISNGNDAAFEGDDSEDGTDINEEENGCLGTPSSVDSGDISIIEGNGMEMHQNVQHKLRNLHQVSITAPDGLKRKNGLKPSRIRTRSATLNTPTEVSILQMLSDDRSPEPEYMTPKRNGLHKTRSDNYMDDTKTVYNNECDITGYCAKRFSLNKHYMHSQPNYINNEHNISPFVAKSCGHTPQSHSNGIMLWNPPKQHEIPPIDLMLDVDEDNKDNEGDDEEEEEAIYLSSSSNMFNNDIDDVEEEEGQHMHIDLDNDNDNGPETPTRANRCKALMLLGISSTESSMISGMGHSFSNNNNRNRLRNYASESVGANKGKKHLLSFRSKLRKSKSSRKVHDAVPHSNPTFKKSVLTKSTSQHLVKNKNKRRIERNKKMKMKMKSTDDKDNKERKVTMSNGHTPQSNISMNSMQSKQWYHDYLRSRGVLSNIESNKSFSKTLTQSELRDIVYEENDIILMETIKQHTSASSVNALQLLGYGTSTKSDYNYNYHHQYHHQHGGAHAHNNTVFASNSYHSDNIRSHLPLNERIFEVLEAKSQYETSSLPPRTFNNYYYSQHSDDIHDNDSQMFDNLDNLDLHKAYSVPNDDANNAFNALQEEDDEEREEHDDDEDDAYNVLVDIAQIKRLQQVHDDDDDDDDDTLINEVLAFNEEDACANQTNNDYNDSDDDLIKAEDGDLYPLDLIQIDKLKKSRSLLDELSRFGPIFHHHPHPQPQPHPHSNSKQSLSLSSKSVKLKKMMIDEFNESVRKRRSRSMPSMEAVNNSSNDSLFQDDDDDNYNEEHGDIVSLLSVLVQHGLYSKKNLNSVQQLTHYNV